MNISISFFKRIFSLPLVVMALFISTFFYACGATKEEMATKERIEKAERMTEVSPIDSTRMPTPAIEKAATKRPLTYKKMEMPKDTM